MAKYLLFTGFLQKDDNLNIRLSRSVSTTDIKLDNEEWSELVKLYSDNHNFKLLVKQIDKGSTAKDLTFCIYDHNMREAAIALYQLFQNTAGEPFVKLREWAKRNINTEMYMYALRLESVFSTKTNDSMLLPPFIWNPHYFVNAESLSKASLVAYDVASTPTIFDTASKRDSNKPKDLIYTINSNYSGWNLQKNGQEDLLNYFREDISLNSYYLGIHLLYPFWMSDLELVRLNPRYVEHYYYIHRQLMARYNLENMHITVKNSSYIFNNWNYVPYLRYKNGLPFPSRSCVFGNWSVEDVYLRTIYTAIREHSRGLVTETNGETLTTKEDNYISILIKLVEAYLDETKIDKTTNSSLENGPNACSTNEYNPTPSVLQHPETSLRDPAYWFMMQYMLNFFDNYVKKNMEPFDLRQYEFDEFKIFDSSFSKLTTFFDYYQFSVNHALSNYIKNENDWLDFLEIRQRRLKHADFSFNFTVKSKVDNDTEVRLFYGPRCDSNNCWNQYIDFIELDTFVHTLKKGINTITWSPETSNRYSFDDNYNSALKKAPPGTKYSIFRFPDNLLIPRGLEEGLNLTLFVMITPYEEERRDSKISKEVNFKPLGFPFHKQAKGFKDTAFNYKFYNISVYHKSLPVDFRGYFSSHLY